MTGIQQSAVDNESARWFVSETTGAVHLLSIKHDGTVTTLPHQPTLEEYPTCPHRCVTRSSATCAMPHRRAGRHAPHERFERPRGRERRSRGQRDRRPIHHGRGEFGTGA